MEIEIKKQVVTETTFKLDVTFPIYLMYDGAYDDDNWSRYDVINRIEADGFFLQLSAEKGWHSPTEFTIKSGNFGDRSLKDELAKYFTEKRYSHFYTSDPTKFESLRHEILEKLSTCGPGGA